MPMPHRSGYEFGKLALAAPDGEKVMTRVQDWPRGRKYGVAQEAVIAGCIPQEAKTER